LWLALAPLSRAGLLDAVASQFEAAHMESMLPVFAAAFAAKFLEGGERLAASAFAGMSSVIPDQEITDLPRKCHALVPALWLALQSILLKGRNAAAPLLLLRLKSGYLLADPKEALLFAASETIEGLLAAITLGPGTRVAISDSCAIEGARLAGWGVPCVTGVPMGWPAKPLPLGATLWTTDADLSPQAQTECAAILESAPMVLENCSHFVERKVSAPRAFDLQFEGLMGALAMSAAGTLSPGETPLQVLDQYRGYDARVEMGEGKMRVRLPLGRRYLKLDREGWLKPLQRVPWLEPRYVEFSWG